jgi:hypothetical protein
MQEALEGLVGRGKVRAHLYLRNCALCARQVASSGSLLSLLNVYACVAGSKAAAAKPTAAPKDAGAIGASKSDQVRLLLPQPCVG